jgi:glycosyltransferase involved in cell wall biosynthesis
MDRPLVSVHMVTYNQQPYIAQAIEGALRQQTDFLFEIVIGEDCSTDGTREIVCAYQKQYPEIIRLIAADRNAGSCANSRKVHAACQAKYIAYCDGDDFWHHPQKLQMQVDFLEKHPDFGLVHTDADRLVQATGELTPCWHKTYHRHAITQGDIYEDLLLDNQVITATACARREHVERYMSDCPINPRPTRLIGDYPVWLFLALVSKVGYLDLSTATRREVANSASVSEDVRKNYAFFLEVHGIQEYFLHRYPPSSRTAARIRCNFHRQKLRYGYLLQDVQVARDSYAYLAQAGLLSVTDRLHLLGSHGKAPHAMARTLIAAKDMIRQTGYGLTPAAGA